MTIKHNLYKTLMYIFHSEDITIFWPNISNNENRDLNLFLWFRRKEETMSAFLSIKLTFWSSWLFIFGHGRTSPDW